VGRRRGVRFDDSLNIFTRLNPTGVSGGTGKSPRLVGFALGDLAGYVGVAQALQKNKSDRVSLIFLVR
jgi:hypothetical protein